MILHPRKGRQTRIGECKSRHMMVQAMYARLIASGYSLRSVSDTAGVSQAAMRSWFRGDGNPSLMSVEAVVSVLGARLVMVEDEHAHT